MPSILTRISYTLDIATDFLFGRSVASLDDSEAKFAGAFAQIQSVQSLIFRAGYVDLLRPVVSPLLCSCLKFCLNDNVIQQAAACTYPTWQLSEGDQNP